MISQGSLHMEVKNKVLGKKIKGVIEDLKQVQSQLMCYWGSNKSL